MESNSIQKGWNYFDDEKTKMSVRSSRGSHRSSPHKQQEKKKPKKEEKDGSKKKGEEKQGKS